MYTLYFADTVDNYNQSSITMHNASQTNRISEENGDRTPESSYPQQPQTNNTISQQKQQHPPAQQQTAQAHRQHNNELKRQSKGKLVLAARLSY